MTQAAIPAENVLRKLIEGRVAALEAEFLGFSQEAQQTIVAEKAGLAEMRDELQQREASFAAYVQRTRETSAMYRSSIRELKAALEGRDLSQPEQPHTAAPVERTRKSARTARAQEDARVTTAPPTPDEALRVKEVEHEHA